MTIFPTTDATFERANIVIDEADSQHKHIPYVLQPEGCGHPAEYVQFTWQYFANRTLAQELGDIGMELFALNKN